MSRYEQSEDLLIDDSVAFVSAFMNEHVQYTGNVLRSAENTCIARYTSEACSSFVVHGTADDAFT